MTANMKHHIVCVDAWLKLMPLDFDHTDAQFISIPPSELKQHLKDATIIVVSSTPIQKSIIDAAEKLQLVAVNGTGTDHIDKVALRERGIWLCHVPAQNTDSVSEHAFALFFAVRRAIIPMHLKVLDGVTWPNATQITKQMGPPPRTCSEETLVVIGHGALGKNIARLGRALGMQVIVAERKGADIVREGRVSFDESLSRGTVFVIVTPLDESTRDMFGTIEFAKMDPTAILVNVGRGGVINETALAQALREGRLGGCATDVFEREPATKDSCPLLDPTIPNLVLSPHVAWYASKTIARTRAVVKSNLEAFAAKQPQNIVLQGQDFALP